MVFAAVARSAQIHLVPRFWMNKNSSSIHHTAICLLRRSIKPRDNIFPSWSNFFLTIHCKWRWLFLHLIILNDIHAVCLPWTRDQLVAETPTWLHTTIKRIGHPVSPAGFKPIIPAGERPQTYALDRVATRICQGKRFVFDCLISFHFFFDLITSLVSLVYWGFRCEKVTSHG
jgi:hypothetical protein